VVTNFWLNITQSYNSFGSNLFKHLAKIGDDLILGHSQLSTMSHFLIQTMGLLPFLIQSPTCVGGCGILLLLLSSEAQQQTQPRCCHSHVKLSGRGLAGLVCKGV